MPRIAQSPFEFWTRLTLTKLTGRQAADLAGLLEHLRAVPLSVVFHHTHHFLVQHQHLNPEPPNDFAYWVTNVLQESWLGERLAAIDTVQPDVVLLDGAYLLRVEGKTRTEKAANAFDELKRLTSRLNIPVIVTMQFNREVKANEAKSVKAEAIALTDVAGWNADLIFALIQTEEMKTNKEMIVKPLKVREGEGIEVRLHWDIGTMNFDEIGPVGKGGGGDADESGAVPDANVDAPF